MKKATAKIKLNGGKILFVHGKVQDTRNIFGRKEYLITRGKIDDFWVSDGNIIKIDKSE